MHKIFGKILYLIQNRSISYKVIYSIACIFCFGLFMCVFVIIFYDMFLWHYLLQIYRFSSIIVYTMMCVTLFKIDYSWKTCDKIFFVAITWVYKFKFYPENFKFSIIPSVSCHFKLKFYPINLYLDLLLKRGFYLWEGGGGVVVV